MRRVECFKQLRVWREARSIRKRIYKVTKIFPGFEKYGLSVQMTRAAVVLQLISLKVLEENSGQRISGSAESVEVPLLNSVTI